MTDPRTTYRLRPLAPEPLPVAPAAVERRRRLHEGLPSAALRACGPVVVPGSVLPAPSVFYEPLKAWWRLLKPYTCAVWLQGEVIRFDVPEGFVFDLASVPRPLWLFVAPFELSITAPLIHDMAYRHRGQLPGAVLSRRDADLVFLEMMRLEQVAAWRRYPAYYAVRRFGQSAWDDTSQLDQTGTA